MKFNIYKISILLIGVILLSVLGLFGAGAAATVDSGTCGDNLTWVLTDDGTLTISGTGEMYDYFVPGIPAPWYQYRSSMSKLILSSGITTIGNYAFYNCSGFTGSLTIPNNVTTINDYAFYNCNGFTGSLTIPNSVTAIYYYAFYNCSGFIGSLTIPNSVTTITSYAFYNCRGFTGSLTIPDSVTRINPYAFYDCNGFTGSLTIPNSVTTIGRCAFSRCSGFTGSLIIPNNLTNIDDSTFWGCSGLNSVSIPASVTKIYHETGFGYTPFRFCTGLTKFIVDSDNQNYSSDTQGLLYNKDKTVLIQVPNKNPYGLDGTLSLPSSVTTISEYAFFQCSDFTGSLIIPDNVTRIGGHTFYNCSGFTGSLAIPNNVTTIDYAAFRGCSGLSSITIPDSVTSINYWAFYGLNLNSVIYREGYATPLSGSGNKYSKDRTVLASRNLTIAPTYNAYTFTVDDQYFPSGFPLTIDNAPVKKAKQFEGWYLNPECTGDKVTSVSNGQTLYAKLRGGETIIDYGTCGDNLTWTISDDGTMTKSTLTISGTGVMYDYDMWNTPWIKYRTQMTTLILPDGLTKIGNYAFYNCKGFTGALTLPKNLTDIGYWAFYGCNGFSCSLVIPKSVTMIGERAFEGCSGFTGALTIPNGVTTIGVNAFSQCRGFTGSLSIPSSVTTIRGGAFSRCTGLTEVIVDSDNLNYSSDTQGLLYNKDKTVLILAPVSNPAGIEGTLVIPSSVTTIGSGAFYGCGGFTGPLVLPNNVTTIGDWAFYGCGGFTGPLVLPNNVTTIGSGAFSDCYRFNGSLIIPNSVTRIGEYAFSDCYRLNGSIIIPNSVTSIGEGVFRYCFDLTKFIVDSDNLYYSSDTQGLLYNKDKTVLLLAPISNPSGIDGTLVIPSSVTTIGGYAFYGCSGFTGPLDLPNNVTTIGTDAFRDCRGFTGSLTIPNSVTTIESGAFFGCSGLYSVALPSNVKIIGQWAFSGLHINSVIYSECSASLLSNKYTRGKTAVAANGTNNAYTFTVDTSSFTSGFPLTDENAPVKEGKIFEGWYENPSYTGDKVTTVTNGQTLYAKWIDGDDGFHLYAGWNVVSTPKKLSSAYDTAAELFADVDTAGHAVLTYNAQTKSWEQVTASTKIEPLNAYWIYSSESKNLPYEFSSTVSSPASKSVYKGWNAVSLSADEPMSAAEAFGNINWYTYLEWNAASQAFKSALIKGGSGTHADTNLVSLWTGGWLFLNEDGTYMGFTA